MVSIVKYLGALTGTRHCSPRPACQKISDHCCFIRHWHRSTALEWSVWALTGTRQSVRPDLPVNKFRIIAVELAEWNLVIILWSLAHLSRRLIGELIVYPWSVVRPSVVRPASVWRPSTMLKHLLTNRLVDWSQILCGASLGRGNEILFAPSGSHDQDGRHAHIW